MNPSQILSQFNDFWGKLGAAQKVSLAVIGSMLVIGLSTLGWWASTPSYATLYSNIASDDAAAVVQKLDEFKIPYRLTRGGNTIEVPSTQVYTARLKMAGEGLPKGRYTGFELFDNNVLGLTDFMQKVNFIRALQGELARTISEIEEVASARVHIVIPDESLFEENRKEPTASIILKLKGGSVLNKQQISGIRYLVASSVVGLKPSNITIVDSSGTVLSQASGENSFDKLSQEQLEAQKAVDRYLEEKAQTMLDTVMGPNQAIVKVTAQLNFQKNDKTIESFDPNSAVVRRESIQNQKRNESPASQGGVPGAKPNVTTETSSSASGGRVIKDSKENISNEYEIDRTVQRVVSEMGNIKKLSVAVYVAQHVNTETHAVQPRTAKEMSDIENMVKTAVGFQNDPLNSRVDEVTVRETGFDTSRREEEAKQLASSRQTTILISLFRYVGMGVVGLGLIFLVYSMAGRLSSASHGSMVSASVRQAEMNKAQLEDAVSKELPEIKEGEEGVKQLEQYLSLLAKERTPDFVNLIRNWIQNPNP